MNKIVDLFQNVNALSYIGWRERENVSEWIVEEARRYIKGTRRDDLILLISGM